LIGSSTQILDNVQIHASVVGQNCTIGTGSIVNDCYIFEDTIIGANCVIEKSIIGSNVHIKDNSYIPRGCLIADSVIIGPDAKLEPFDRLSARGDLLEPNPCNEDIDSDIEDIEASFVIVLTFLPVDPDAHPVQGKVPLMRT